MNPPKIYQEELNKILDLNKKAQELKLDVWAEYVVFTWHWWVGVCLTIIPWILWLQFRKKESSNRMLFAGFFVMLISTFLDFLGTKLELWYYYYEVIPFIPAFIPWDLTLIPVSAMFLIEFKPNINPFLKSIFFGILTAFIAGPLFQFVGLYKEVKWSPVFSLPIFSIIFFVGHYLSTRESFEKTSC